MLAAIGWGAYLLIGCVVGAIIAYKYEASSQWDFWQPWGLGLAAAVGGWPLIGIVLGAVEIQRAGERKRRRDEQAREEEHRQLALIEAQLAREGVYGEEAKQKQLAADNAYERSYVRGGMYL